MDYLQYKLLEIQYDDMIEAFRVLNLIINGLPSIPITGDGDYGIYGNKF